MAEDTPEKTDEIVLNVVPRLEEYIDPNMPNVTKVGKMARLCYRVPDADNPADQHAHDLRIIKRCITEGHESVLEHGAISLFINNSENDDNKTFSKCINGEPTVSFPRIWNSIVTDAERKYAEPFMDPDIYQRFKKREFDETVADSERRVMPTIVADIRAWRTIINEKIYVATGKSDQLSILLITKALYELNKADEDGIFFGDLVEKFNKMFTDKAIHDALIISDDAEENLKDFTVAGVSEFYFKDKETMYAAQASGCATMSVILQTDRALTHQLVRHRKNVAYSQESQRYVDYDKKGYRCIPMTVEPTKFPADFISDYDRGSVRSTSKAYEEWLRAMKDAFTHYHNLKHIYEDETGKSDIIIPSETCRGVLPNDAATKIGVTWLKGATFINLCYWRLEEHAQYSIRSTLARIVINECLREHPFIEVIPYGIVIKWIEQIKEQKLLNDNDMVENCLNRWKTKAAYLKKFIEEQKKAEEEARKKLEEEQKKEETNEKLPDPPAEIPASSEPVEK